MDTPSSLKPPACGSRDRLYPVLAIMFALALFRLWILPMRNSFWLDETLIGWTVRDGFMSVIPHAFISLQSITFCMVESLFAQVSRSEISMRLPSLLSACATVYVFYRIGLEAADRELGILFAALFVVMPSVAVEVPNARPYALALFFHTAALYCLLAWLRSGRVKHGLLWVMCAVIAAHGHHLFVTVLPIETLFMVWHSLRHRAPILRMQLVICSAVGVVLLIPAAPQALVFLSQAGLLSYSTQPSWFALLSTIIPVALFSALAFVALVEFSEGWRPRWTAQRPGKDAVMLAAMILFVPAIAFFAVSRFTATHIFEPRYLLPTVPGVVILWGWLLRGLEVAFLRYFTIVALLLQSIVFVGGTSLVPDYRGEDWRGAVQALPESEVLVVYPGLVETRRLDWLQSPERWSYFTAPVSAYRSGLSQTRTFVLPFEIGLADQAYADRLTIDSLRSQERINLVVRGNFAGPAWLAWFDSRLSTLGFRKERQSTFGSVQLHTFVSKNSYPTAARITTADRTLTVAQ